MKAATAARTSERGARISSARRELYFPSARTCHWRRRQTKRESGGGGGSHSVSPIWCSLISRIHLLLLASAFFANRCFSAGDVSFACKQTLEMRARVRVACRASARRRPLFDYLDWARDDDRLTQTGSRVCACDSARRRLVTAFKGASGCRLKRARDDLPCNSWPHSVSRRRRPKLSWPPKPVHSVDSVAASVCQQLILSLFLINFACVVGVFNSFSAASMFYFNGIPVCCRASTASEPAPASRSGRRPARN